MKPFVWVLIVFFVTATPLSAHPYMIRLGYATCSACHISPQGGGLLTPYGQGIEGELSLRRHQYEQVDDREAPDVQYDMRVLPVPNWTNGVSGTTVQALLLGSLRAGAHNRVTYSMSVTSPPLTSTSLGSSPTVFDVPTLVWEYRPVQNFELVAGRDALPAALQTPDLQTFIRKSTDPGASPYPMQVKAFWWTKRLQVTPYVFDNTSAAEHEHGVGVVAGVVGWNQHAVVGLTTVNAQADTFDRRMVGAYARLGFGNRWSLLTEHQLIDRTSSLTTGYEAGHTRLIFVPVPWLETWATLEELVTDTPTHTHVVRVTPGFLARVSEHLLTGFTSREVLTPKGPSWTYSINLTIRSFN
jgi:hypothetical protein